MITYRTIRTNRKTLAIQIKGNEVIVRSPYGVSDARIKELVLQKEDWIQKHLNASTQKEEEIEKLTSKEIEALAQKAMDVIPKRVAYYASKMGVSYQRITIRMQKTRWGSCSSKGNLNFNCLLMLMPQEVIDSVVVHELCHRKEMNHSKKFYEEVLKVYPEYPKWNQWLKENGKQILKRAF